MCLKGSRRFEWCGATYANSSPSLSSSCKRWGAVIINVETETGIFPEKRLVLGIIIDDTVTVVLAVKTTTPKGSAKELASSSSL